MHIFMSMYYEHLGLYISIYSDLSLENYQHSGPKFTKALMFMMLHNVEVGLLSALIIVIVPHIKIYMYYLCRKGDLSLTHVYYKGNFT